MQGPAILADGHTYERGAAVEQLRQHKSTSPVTGAPLPHKRLLANVLIKQVIACQNQQQALKFSVSSSRGSVSSNEFHGQCCCQHSPRDTSQQASLPQEGMVCKGAAQSCLSNRCPWLAESGPVTLLPCKLKLFAEVLSLMVTSDQVTAAAVLHCCVLHTVCQTTTDEEVATHLDQHATSTSLANAPIAACCSRLI